jgi:hypothetical protein
LAKLISSRQQRTLGWHLKASMIAFKKKGEKMARDADVGEIAERDGQLGKS